MTRATKSIISIFVFVSLMFPSIGLGSDKDSLTEKIWSLKKIQGVKVPEGASLIFEPLKVTGSTGCNKFWAPIEYKGNSEIDIGPPQSARLYCLGVMGLERAYLAALESIISFHLNGTNLKMMLQDGDVFLEFEANSRE